MGNQCEFLSVLGNLLWSPWHFKNRVWPLSANSLGTHRCVGSQACVGSVCVNVPWPGPAPWRSGFPVLQFFLQDRASEEEPVAGWWLAACKLKANLGWWALAPYISSLKETWDVLDHLSSGHWYIETAHLPWQLGRGAHGLPLMRNRRTARVTWESATFTIFWKDWTVEANLVFSSLLYLNQKVIDLEICSETRDLRCSIALEHIFPCRKTKGLWLWGPKKGCKSLGEQALDKMNFTPRVFVFLLEMLLHQLRGISGLHKKNYCQGWPKEVPFQLN